MQDHLAGRAARGPIHGTASGWLLLVHSHLRWDFVWQRPQQLLSRLASRGRVVFVEEPIHVDDAAAPRLEISAPHAGVCRVVPILPAALRDRYDDGIAAVRAALRAALAPGAALAGDEGAVVQWFYTPMPAPEMLGAFGERAVVYDCMDELAQFRFAPSDLPHRERLLLARADVVFTGGARLYESKSRYHDNVHFFGCGVDAAHFGRARAAGTAVPGDAAALPRPVLGYVGVVDERMDYGLVRAIAGVHPEWSLAMVGPVVKVDPAELPRRPNIHWLGQRRYADLPGYVKGFDVCLMPFALNEATEYINPTKTLEYMAAGRPIVSTAVPDVVRNFTPVVRIARSAPEFIAACERAVAEPDDARIALGLERARQASWESIVARMGDIIADAMAQEPLAAANAALDDESWEESAGPTLVSDAVGGEERYPDLAPDRLDGSRPDVA